MDGGWGTGECRLGHEGSAAACQVIAASTVTDLLRAKLATHKEHGRGHASAE